MGMFQRKVPAMLYVSTPSGQAVAIVICRGALHPMDSKADLAEGGAPSLGACLHREVEDVQALKADAIL